MHSKNADSPAGSKECQGTYWRAGDVDGVNTQFSSTSLRVLRTHGPEGRAGDVDGVEAAEMSMLPQPLPNIRS